MITYFLKSFVCLAILLTFYHLVLEREKMHQFNRFYLLGSVLFSFIAPLYSIHTVIPVEAFQTPTTYGNEIIVNENTSLETPIDYWNIALVFSGLITFILTIRFGLNLFKIFRKVSKNTTIKQDKAVLVLVEDAISPHTFWNYIFINKDEYNSHKIEDELFTHELTHVTQKHTFDVLLIEVLKIVFWFNPLFYFLKKSIQLNHEFIADEKVINSFKNISEYQYLLLNKAAWNNDYYLASNLNYSLTKKRLVMMTTKTSKVNNWLKKIAVVPLLLGSIYVFAERVETYEEVNNKEFLDAEINKSNFQIENSTASLETLKDIKEKLKYANSLKISLLDKQKDTFESKLPNGDKIKVWEVFENKDSIPTLKKIVNGKKRTFTYTTKNGKTITKKFADLTEEEKKLMPPPPAPIVLKEKTLSAKLFQELKNSKKYAIWIDGKIAKNEILNNYKNTDFYNYSGSFIHKNARSKRFPQEYQYSLNTKKHILKIKKQLPPPPQPAKSKTLKEVKPVKIEVKETPKTGFINVKNKTLYYVKNKNGTTYYNRWGREVTKEGKIINPEQTASNKVIPGQNITKVYKDDKVVSEFKQSKIAPPPPPKSKFPEIKKDEKSNIPPPPPPISAMELISKYPNATFYFNNQKESYEEVLALIEKQKGLNVLTQDKNGEKIIKFTSKDRVEKGWKYINNETIYYIKKNGKTEYFDRWGNSVDINGKKIKESTN